MFLLLSCTSGPVDLPDETEPIDSSVPEDSGCEETTYYMDVDGDGHGDENNPVESCEPITGAVIASGDCDDGDFEIGPDIEEECGDGFDNDCDGEIDEAAEGCEEEPDFVTLSFEDPLATILSDLPLAEIGGPFTSVADQDGDGVNDIALYIRSQSEFDERAYFFQRGGSGRHHLHVRVEPHLRRRGRLRQRAVHPRPGRGWRDGPVDQRALGLRKRRHLPADAPFHVR